MLWCPIRSLIFWVASPSWLRSETNVCRSSRGHQDFPQACRQRHHPEAIADLRGGQRGAVRIGEHQPAVLVGGAGSAFVGGLDALCGVQGARGGGRLDAEHRQFAVHPPVAPARVLPHQAKDESPDGADGRWSPRTLGAGVSGVPPRDQVPVPAQYCVRPHEQPRPPQYATRPSASSHRSTTRRPQVA